MVRFSGTITIFLAAIVASGLILGCTSGKRTVRKAPETKAAISIEEQEEILAGLESLPKDLGKNGLKDHRVAYTVGPDDVVNVEVRQHPDIGGQFMVSPEGTIFISLIGSVDVEDATTEQISSRIEERLQEYVREPEVAVSVLAYNSKKVYVLGQVGKPGEYMMRGNTLSVRDAVLLAGLPRDTASLHRVAVITPDDENPQVVLVNMNDILYRGILKENINLRPGDVVVVHRNLFAKLGAFLDQVLGPTQRVRSIEGIMDTFDSK